jgi:tRNA A-37 threonylcarbamoyl transferase component Bud32
VKFPPLSNAQRLEKGEFLWIAEDWQNEPFINFVKEIPTRFEKGNVIYNERNTLVTFRAKENNCLINDIVIKKFNINKKYDRLRFKFIKSKAVRSLIITNALNHIGVKTPKPLAVVEQRGKSKELVYSYYITEYIPYDYNLLDIINQKDHPYHHQIINFLPYIAEDVRKMHDAGIVHNDLHAGNVLIKNIDSSPEFYYIDLNRARINGKLASKKRMKDLARFDFSQNEQEVFLRHYAPEGYSELLNLLFKLRKKRENAIKRKRKIKNIFK